MNTPDFRLTAPAEGRTSGPMVNVLDDGARGDGRELCTQALQQAINACSPDGTVLIPPGCYRTGALFLKSAMTPHLEEGAMLLGSENVADYPIMPGQFEGRKIRMYASLITCTPTFRSITFQNITLETAGGNVISISGLPESPVDGLTLRRIRAKGKQGMQVHNVTHFTMEDVTVDIVPASAQEGY
ncbi:MAG: hypothetical protein ACI4MJ_03140 [Aristaeellaceae bacterium]